MSKTSMPPRTTSPTATRRAGFNEAGAANLRRLLDEKQIDLRTLYQALHLSPAVTRRLLEGRRPLTVSDLGRLCVLLELGFADIYVALWGEREQGNPITSIEGESKRYGYGGSLDYRPIRVAWEGCLPEDVSSAQGRALTDSAAAAGITVFELSELEVDRILADLEVLDVATEGEQR